MPLSGQWGDPTIQRAFECSSVPSSKLSGGAISGIVIGSVLALVLLVIGLLFCSRRFGHPNPKPAPEVTESGSITGQPVPTSLATELGPIFEPPGLPRRSVVEAP